MNAGMWNAYTSMYSAVTARLSSLRGSHAWPIATRTMAKYLALSKNASRSLTDRAVCAGAEAVPSCAPGGGAFGCPSVRSASVC